MKIGPIDIGLPLLINIGGCVGVGLVVLALWKSGGDLRYESYYRDKIIRGLTDGIPDRQAEGIAACREFLKIEPNHIPARLSLANTLALSGDFAEARKVYEETAKLPAIQPLPKAIALNGAGVSAFRAADAAGRTPVLLDEVEKLLRGALEADASFADAQANLALLQQYRKPQDWHAAAEPLANAALAAPVPPTAEALENLYRLSGLIYQHKKLGPMALRSFEAVQSVRPAGKGGSEQMRVASRLSSVMQPGMTAEQRITQINELERALPSIMDKQRVSLALTAMGLGYMELKNEADFQTQGFTPGVRSFQRALEAEINNRLAFDNLSALYDIRIAQIAAQLKNPVTGFNGVSPEPDVIKDGPRAKRFQIIDKPTLAELRRLLREQEDVWKKFVERVPVPDAEKIEPRLLMLIAIRRQAYTMDTDEEAVLKLTYERGMTVVKELEKIAPDNGAVHFAAAMLMIDLKKFTEAHTRLLLAAEKGFKSPQLDSLLAALSGKPVMIGARPAEGQRWFGTRPLISATLYAPNATDGFKSIDMTYNGKPANPMLIGTQALFLPEAAQLTDGKHTIKVSVVETATQKTVEFLPLEFSIDRLPPAWKLSPDGGEVDGNAAFTISLSDPNGVDLTSVRVVFRSADNAKNPTNREIVLSGRYKVTAPNLGLKTNATIPGDSFKVGAGSIPLPPGTYVLEIAAKDLSGNEMKSNKGFLVK